MSLSFEKSILTGRRCIVLTKFPEALSGGNKENLAPVAGEKAVITALNSSPG